MDQKIDILNNNISTIEFDGKMYPSGAIPALFRDKLALLNNLIKELGPVYDNENPEWFISVVNYNEKEGKLYFDCKEEVK